MKNYPKTIALILCFGFFHSAYAQFGTKVGIAANLSIPTSDFANIAKTGFGATGYFLANASPKFSFTASFGYFIFGKQLENTDGQNIEYSVKAIPFLLGFRYYLGTPTGPSPYIGGLTGVYSMILNAEGEGTPSIPIEETERRGRISFGPAIGIEFSKLDIMAFYMFIPDKLGDINLNYNHFGLQIGIGF
jgi:hypothetical protein